MLDYAVKRWEEKKADLRADLTNFHPEGYKDIVKLIIKHLAEEDNYEDDILAADINRVSEIDYGNYQGTLLYIIGRQGYQPSQYWAVKVDYGSCSGCDTLQKIINWDDTQPNTEEQINDYMTLCLHIVQGLMEI